MTVLFKICNWYKYGLDNSAMNIAEKHVRYSEHRGLLTPPNTVFESSDLSRY